LLPTILSALALIVALVALLRSRANTAGSPDSDREARRRLAQQIEGLESSIQAQNRWISMLAAGEPLTPEMIADDQPFHDVDPSAAQKLAQEQGAVWIDVRTAQEVASGMIPGATWIPMDQIETRLAEIPRDRALLVYCASGGRSAGVCQFLATQGFLRLHNLQDGIRSWTGALHRPSA